MPFVRHGEEEALRLLKLGYSQSLTMESLLYPIHIARDDQTKFYGHNEDSWYNVIVEIRRIQVFMLRFVEIEKVIPLKLSRYTPG